MPGEGRTTTPLLTTEDDIRDRTRGATGVYCIAVVAHGQGTWRLKSE